jgi:hypothetical protein
MTTTMDDDFGDAEHATAATSPEAPETVAKVPEIVARIGAPPRGAFTRPAPRRSYLVEQVIRSTDDDGRTTYTDTRGVIGRGQLHILAGEGGAGKGRWLLTIAAALAASDSPKQPDPAAIADLTAHHPGGMDNVCGLRVNGIPDDEKVLVLLGEDDATDIHQRFEGVAEALGWQKNAAREDRLVDRFRWGTAHGLTFSVVDTVRTAGGEVEARASGDFTALQVWLRQNGPWAFIAMDPMARFAGVDENDNALQTKVYALVEGLTKVNPDDRAPPAVVVVDHISKPSKDGTGEATQHMIRGAGAKVNAARVAMLMIPGAKERVVVDREGRTAAEEGHDDSEVADIGEPVRVTWHVVKNNGQQKADPVSLGFTKHGGLYVEDAAAARGRRKSQWHAAQKRGQTQKKGETQQRKGDSAGKKPTAPTPSGIA